MKLTEMEQWKTKLMPLVFKGFECGVAQIQGALMNKIPTLIQQVHDPIYLRTQVLPKFLQGVLNAKTLEVKEKGLQSLAEIYGVFDRATTVDVILPSLEKFRKMEVTGVMLMYLLEVYEGISKTLGHKVTAINILPAITPLLIDGEVDKTQFNRIVDSLVKMLEFIRHARVLEIGEKGIVTKESAPQENLDGRLQIDDDAKDVFEHLFATEEPIIKVKPHEELPVSNDIFMQHKYELPSFPVTDARIVPPHKKEEFKPQQSTPDPFSRIFDRTQPVIQPIVQPVTQPVFQPPAFQPPAFQPPAFQPPVFQPPAFQPPAFQQPTQQVQFAGLQWKQPARTPQLNSDDFFNEFLSDKRDPFAGL